MIAGISIISVLGKQPVIFNDDFALPIAICCQKMIEKGTTSFDIEILFDQQIQSFRNHDYSWADLGQTRVANSFSPKIIRLADGHYVQSNINHGIWEVRKKEPKKLLWRFSPETSEPLAQYTGQDNRKVIAAAQPDLSAFVIPALLFSKKGAVELSRSKIPFVATACFTDHCDFDTAENLTKQRLFFRENQIKTTKGFFLNHFSKRADNASWENDAAELQLWQQDGHELCYHSLSQSIKSRQDSLDDFFSFAPPFPIKTWIDHGYQPYNLSLFQKEGVNETGFAQNLSDKKIAVLWNYIDSGTATSGVLNQMNPQHFTLSAFRKGIRNKPFKTRLALLIKNSIVHFYADEKLTKKYASLAAAFKKAMASKSLKVLAQFMANGFNVGFPLLKLKLSYHKAKDKTYPLAQYQNLFFDHVLAGKKFTIFQTLEMVDFATALEKKSVDGFVSEKGLFVAHTYFSVPMSYHDGRIFDASGEVQPKVAENFGYLGQLIKEQKIWNPTLGELLAHWKAINAATFELCDGTITVKNAPEVPQRNII